MLAVSVTRYRWRPQVEGEAEGLEEPAGDVLRSFRHGVPVGEDDELVTPEPADAVALAHDRRQAFRHRPEQVVARCVAERVVDLLEPVEVDEECPDPASSRRVRAGIRSMRSMMRARWGGR